MGLETVLGAGDIRHTTGSFLPSAEEEVDGNRFASGLRPQSVMPGYRQAARFLATPR
jgi:hypothetical protein